MPREKVICLSDNLAPFGGGYWAEHGLSFYVESGCRIPEEVRQAGVRLKGYQLTIFYK